MLGRTSRRLPAARTMLQSRSASKVGTVGFASRALNAVTTSAISPCWGASALRVCRARNRSLCVVAGAEEKEQEPAYASKDLTGYKLFQFEESFKLRAGGELPRLDIAWESWGRLNRNRDNAILLTCGMSASSHARSHHNNEAPGWWENFIGPGKAVDTNLFYVICTNNLGGCYGTTGPSSIDPRTGEAYGSRFPRFDVQDMVRAQFLFLDHLGIEKVHAVVGSSLGGMQSVCAATMFPDRLKKFVSISGCARSFPGSAAFRHTQRQAVMSDPNWNGGDYYDRQLPAAGLRLAREIGTITYRSGQEWRERFQQSRCIEPPAFGVSQNEFVIEQYLSHQGEKWVSQYDPNSMIWISKAMDGFTLAVEGNLVAGLQKAQMPAMVIGVKYDQLFPIWQQKELRDALMNAGNAHVAYYEIDSVFGHDSFLLDRVSIGPAVKGFLEQEPHGARHMWEELASVVARTQIAGSGELLGHKARVVFGRWDQDLDNKLSRSDLLNALHELYDELNLPPPSQATVQKAMSQIRGEHATMDEEQFIEWFRDMVATAHTQDLGDLSGM